jgi:hypothetical protein
MTFSFKAIYYVKDHDELDFLVDPWVDTFNDVKMMKKTKAEDTAPKIPLKRNSRGVAGGGIMNDDSYDANSLEYFSELADFLRPKDRLILG